MQRKHWLVFLALGACATTSHESVSTSEADDELQVVAAVRDAFKHPQEPILLNTEGWSRFILTPQQEAELRQSPYFVEGLRFPWDECLKPEPGTSALQRDWCERNREDSRLPSGPAATALGLRFVHAEPDTALQRIGTHLSFSRVGFDTARRQALVTFVFACPLCGSSYTVWLERESGGWVVTRSRMEWIS